MIHVDDRLVVGTRKAAMEDFNPALKTKYGISVQTMSKGGDGDEVSFLKRTHLLDDGRMVIKSLMGTLSALGTLAQLTQLQGCNFTFSPFGLETMDTVAADAQFEVKFLMTWLLMLVGYGVYLNWMRCTGREERAAAKRDPMRLGRYRQLKLSLQQVLCFLHATPMEYQRVQKMLHMISDLSSDEDSPGRDVPENGINLGAAAAATVAAGLVSGWM
eukprot:s848_g12.t1